jgi:hypothetical protein
MDARLYLSDDQKVSPARRRVGREPTRLRLPGSFESLCPEKDGITTTEVGDHIERRHQPGFLLLLLTVIAAKQVRLDDVARPDLGQIHPCPVDRMPGW